MSVEVRLLIVDDVFVAARMLSKVTKAARAELAHALVARRDAEPLPQDELEKLNPKQRKEYAEKLAEAQANLPNPTELGLALVQNLFIESEADLKAWLASLIGKTADEFKVMPATTIIDIVDGLLAQEGIMDFFERVSQLVSKGEGVA